MHTYNNKTGKKDNNESLIHVWKKIFLKDEFHNEKGKHMKKVNQFQQQKRSQNRSHNFNNTNTQGQAHTNTKKQQNAMEMAHMKQAQVINAICNCNAYDKLMQGIYTLA